MADLEKDEFDLAFAEAAAAVDGMDVPEVAAPDPAPVTDPVPVPVTDPAPVTDPVLAPVTDPAPAPVTDPAPAPVTDPAPAPVPEVKAKPEPRVEPEVKAKPEPAPKPEPVPETPEQKAAREQFEESIKPYVYTAEEVAAIEKMKADFPNEFAAMEAKFKTTDRDINARVYNAVTAVLNHMNATVTPLAEGFNAKSEKEHFAALRSAHTDYDEVIAKVPDWIETQPAYLRPALHKVYESGTTQDVIALVADFKKSTTPAVSDDSEAKHFAAIHGAHPDYDEVVEKVPAWIKTQPIHVRPVLQQVYESGATQDVIDLIADFKKATAGNATKPAPVVPPVAPKAKPQDGADLAPVGVKRVTTLPKGTPDPSDFDAAWAEAVREVDARP